MKFQLIGVHAFENPNLLLPGLIQASSSEATCTVFLTMIAERVAITSCFGWRMSASSQTHSAVPLG